MAKIPQPSKERFTEKITVYISKEQAQEIQKLPRNFNLSGKMRKALERILKKERGDSNNVR
jgi:hypothetical protein